jgi:hypothetical protein
MTSIRTITLLCISLASVAAIAQTSYNRIGNTTYGSNGQTYQQIGNTTYGSDGTTASRIGNSTYITTPAARSTTCTQIGSQTYCN